MRHHLRNLFSESVRDCQADIFGQILLIGYRATIERCFGEDPIDDVIKKGRDAESSDCVGGIQLLSRRKYSESRLMLSLVNVISRLM